MRGQSSSATTRSRWGKSLQSGPINSGFFQAQVQQDVRSRPSWASHSHTPPDCPVEPLDAFCGSEHAGPVDQLEQHLGEAIFSLMLLDARDAAFWRPTLHGRAKASPESSTRPKLEGNEKRKCCATRPSRTL